MSSIRKWLASKVFSTVLSGDGSRLNESSSNGNGGLSNWIGAYSSELSSVDSMIRAGISPEFSIETNENDEDQSYFSVIYHHYRSKMRKKHAISDQKLLKIHLYQFYQANEELNFISSELDTFDGRKDTDRCSALVNSLKIAQDRVISLIFKIMDEIGCERSSREYRLKFPDELLTGEGIESLNSQIWFGAECLTGGSTITNNLDKSNYLRPIAKNFTTTLDLIRYELRSCCNHSPKNCVKISKDLIRKLEIFDTIFTSFEYDYVKAMLQIKSSVDIENLQELTYLFSETLTYALRKGLISKDDVDGCQPNVMIALPRLSIVRGLLQGPGSVVCKLNRDELTSILKPYHSLLLEFHEFLMNLNEDEIFFLEKLLSTNHENMDMSDNDPSLPLVDGVGGGPNQDSLLSVFNKFFKHAKRMKDSGARTHQVHHHKKSLPGKSISNRYISASVDFLLINNRNDCNDDSNNNNNNNNNNNHNNRYSPFKSNEMLFRFNSLPNINFYNAKNENNSNGDGYGSTMGRNGNNLRSHDSSSVSPDYSSTTSTSSCPSVSITSSSSVSMELDFLKQFKDMLKRTQLKTLTKSRNPNDGNVRSTSSGFYNSSGFHTATATTAAAAAAANEAANPRAKTAFTDVLNVDFVNECFKPNSIFTPTTSAFSNNSIHFDLDTFYTDDLSQLTVYTKKILHQVFVMISRIADEFQTNYASELRNILRTVFLLQDFDGNSAPLDGGSLVRSVDVQMGEFDEEDAVYDHMDKIEQAIDAHEYLGQENFSLENVPSTSHSSQPPPPPHHEQVSDLNNCDIFGANNHHHQNGVLPHASSLADMDSTGEPIASNSCNNNFSATIRGSSASLDSQTMNGTQSGSAGGGGGLFAGRPTGNSGQLRHSNASISSLHSSENSYRSLQNSQVTSSSATTIDEANRGDLPSFMFPNLASNSSPSLSSPMIPILGGNVSGPSASSATNLLLPPIWMPDECVTTCQSCTQAFNLIRRRHHCRRCGQIFCNQCSNNFVSLKCFGYAKPVRVCNTCLILHKQSEQRMAETHIPDTTFGASS